MPARRLAQLVPCAAVAVLLASAMANIARADDQPFLTLDATDIEPELGHELEQSFAWRAGRSGQSFNSLEGETELEYGLTDQLQLAGAVDYDWTRTRDHTIAGTPAIGGSAVEAVRGEIIYQALNVYFDPIGLGLLISPAFGRNSRSMETKILLQKNFINDRLRTVLNLGGEFGAERDGGAWSDVSALTFDAGIAYNITWEWSAAIEFNAQYNFQGLILNGRAVPGVSTYYAGPTVQYVDHPWTASLAVQEQLPWASDATHALGSLDRGFAADSERFRVLFRITRDTF
jgi:hypothetical protein